MSSYRYAAYGSNLHPGRLRARVPSAAFVGTGFLPSYSLRFHKRGKKDGSGKCNIVVGESGVFVAVFEIAKAERIALDKCEGLGYGYNHREIEIPEHGLCSTYIADPSAVDDTLRPVDWYKEYVLRGARFHGFPIEYVAALESISADADSDRSRSRHEWERISKLDNGT